MSKFDFRGALRKLGIKSASKINEIKNYRIPKWAKGVDFENYFLPYLVVIGDSREQSKWVEDACKYYGIKFEWAKKDKKAGTENLKEGDYTFRVVMGDNVFDYTGIVAYERKGSVAEFYGNCVGTDRERIEKEFTRFVEKGYKKVVLMLEFGECITDLIDMGFEFRGPHGKLQRRNTYNVMYSAVMSWKQPNNKKFDVIQSNSHLKLFWLFVQLPSILYCLIYSEDCGDLF